jgi:RNA polymerase sigma-70 factor, ECF subfamily
LHEDEENRILRNVQRGDEAAFSTLVERFEERIFRLAWRITNDAALAEEATAEVLVKLWTRAGQWRGESPARTWIFRIAVRTTLDVQRSQQRWWRRWSGWLPAVIDKRPGPADLAEKAEDCQLTAVRLQAALMQLTPSDRALVHLFYFENRGLPEIETILGVNRDALKMRLARARKRLRQLWNTDPLSPLSE